ncbi:MAG: hypothetical protein OXB88_02895 [Bacteriovoracales bacterium]|nr:hypothetical protein [Bacteriovoracales bacterium]
MTLLDKSFGQILVGRHHLSFIAGLGLLHRKESVLLIDDERARPGPLWGQFLSPLDVRYLELWGIATNIDELKGLAHYIEGVPLKFYMGDKLIYLPGRPFDNVRELLRWFPDVFSEAENIVGGSGEEFDRDFERGSERLAEVSFRMRTTQTLRPHFFEEMDWPLFEDLSKKAFESYQNLLTTRPSHPFIQFINLGKSLYHREILLEIDEFEMGHLLLSFLGPLYRLDSKTFEQDLCSRFLERGGLCKKAHINHWQIHENELAHIELDSFEGVLPVHHCHLMGPLCPQFPFDSEVESEKYRSAFYRIRGPGCFDLIPKERILYSGFDHLGSDIPLIDFYAPSPDLLYAFVAYRHRHKSKYNFYQKYLRSFLDQALEQVPIRQIPQRDLKIEVEEGESFWIHRNEMSFEKNCQTRKKRLDLMETPRGPGQTKIRRLDHWGPSRCYSIGIFSYLLELKEHLTHVPGPISPSPKNPGPQGPVGSPGQTTVEYLLLIGVLSVIFFSLLPLMKNRLVGDGNCRGQDSQTIFCRIISSMGLEGGARGTYRTFTLKR